MRWPDVEGVYYIYSEYLSKGTPTLYLALDTALSTNEYMKIYYAVKATGDEGRRLADAKIAETQWDRLHTTLCKLMPGAQASEFVAEIRNRQD